MATRPKESIRPNIEPLQKGAMSALSTLSRRPDKRSATKKVDVRPKLALKVSQDVVEAASHVLGEAEKKAKKDKVELGSEERYKIIEGTIADMIPQFSKLGSEEKPKIVEEVAYRMEILNALRASTRRKGNRLGNQFLRVQADYRGKSRYSE